MRKTIIYLIFFSLSFTACKSKNIKSNNDSIKIEIKNSYKIGETINVTIINTSKGSLTLYNPTKLNFQKKNEGKWKHLRILPCPCDAPCQAPPEKLEMPSKKAQKLTWQQKESYCGTKKVANNVRETIYKQVEKGTYRFVVKYKQNEKEETIYKEFNIK